MSAWHERKSRLNTLLAVAGDEDAHGLALDRILHGQSVIGQTSKTTEVDKIKFGDKDLHVLGTLEYGQYGVIDVVTCKLNGKAYVRKSVDKKLALRTQDQCSPQFERDILLRALKSGTHWAPHLLCAFQTETHLNLVMEYAEGGTLWDVLESSPLDGRIAEADVRWWAPQIIMALDWCHSQGFVHRDVKPHNFVLDTTGHVLLIDFGSSAPLLPAGADGSQRVPKRHCLVPCGTCDYISPEILECHEEALVALEMADDIDDPPSISIHEAGGYGRETDWWSFGAMLYEMVYGMAPFFANDIRQTYAKTMDHQRSLRFKSSVHVSGELQDLIRRFLTTAELRLGRQSVEEIHKHAFFDYFPWMNSPNVKKPESLHLPQFTYATPTAVDPQAGQLDASQGAEDPAFAFSALFQSTASSHAFSVLHQTPSQKSSRSILRERPGSSFIGFSWGPTIDAFDGIHNPSPLRQTVATPRILHTAFTPMRTRSASVKVGDTPQRYPFATPVRPSFSTPFQTATRTGTARRRPVSDREAMKQLVSCVGMSARKKVLESGRKPRILTSASAAGTGTGSRASTLKELRFDRSVMVYNGDSGGVSYRMDPTTTTTTSESGGGASFSIMSASVSSSGYRESSRPSLVLVQSEADEESSVESECVYSPSPSPRPGSAMSGVISRRSQTPTLGANSTAHMPRIGQRSVQATDNRGTAAARLPVDPEWADAGPEEPALIVIPQSKSPPSDALDDLERRHARLMKDIVGLGTRLSALTVHFGG